MSKKLDLTGVRFGRLTGVRGIGDKWECLCDCGNRRTVLTMNLRQGRTKSCGCFNDERRKERMTKHGMIKSPEYQSWKCMRERCTNPSHEHWKYYGGIGVTVCHRWMNSFADFYSDMGNSNGLTIDRIDPTGNYEPDNCKWSNMIEQRANRRKVA